MSQRDILEYMAKHPCKAVTAKELSIALGLRLNVIHANLRKLRNSDQIKYTFTRYKCVVSYLYYSPPSTYECITEGL